MLLLSWFGKIKLYINIQSSVNKKIFHYNNLVIWEKYPKLSILGMENVRRGNPPGGNVPHLADGWVTGSPCTFLIKTARTEAIATAPRSNELRCGVFAVKGVEALAGHEQTRCLLAVDTCTCIRLRKSHDDSCACNISVVSIWTQGTVDVTCHILTGFLALQ